MGAHLATYLMASGALSSHLVKQVQETEDCVVALQGHLNTAVTRTEELAS